MAAVVEIPGAAQPLAVVNGLPEPRLFIAREYQPRRFSKNLAQGQRFAAAGRGCSEAA
jgi:hypothetical protein